MPCESLFEGEIWLITTLRTIEKRFNVTVSDI